MVKITLYWMDLIRLRLKNFKYKDKKGRKVISSFIKPIMLIGSKDERNLNISLVQSKKDALKYRSVVKKKMDNLSKEVQKLYAAK